MLPAKEVALTLMGYQFFDIDGNPCELSTAFEPGIKYVPRDGPSLQTLLEFNPRKDDTGTEQSSGDNNSARTASWSKENIPRKKLDARRENGDEKLLSEEPSVDVEEVSIGDTSMLHFDLQDSVEKDLQPAERTLAAN